MSSGTSLLRFRCTGCGNCCRDVRVPITDADLVRLIDETRASAKELVDWLPADAVDITGEPETLVRLPDGFRLMVLRHRASACVLLRDDRCTVYSARPTPCRVYPLDASFGRRGGIRRLRLLAGTDCDFRRDGRVDPKALRSDTLRQRDELARYRARVSEWNTLQRRRARFHRALGDEAALIRFLVSHQLDKSDCLPTAPNPSFV